MFYTIFITGYILDRRISTLFRDMLHIQYTYICAYKIWYTRRLKRKKGTLSIVVYYLQPSARENTSRMSVASTAIIHSYTN